MSRPAATTALLLLLLSGGCRVGKAGTVQELVPEITMEGVRFSVERGGITRARGEADRLTYRRDTTAVAAEGLALTLLGSDGEVRITAPRGAGVAADRRFDVDGGVQASRGGDLATTRSAHYEAPHEGPGLVTGPEPVVVTGPGYRLTGKSFRLDPASGELSLRGGARLVSGLPVAR